MKKGMGKYGAIRTEVDGIVFASKKEARRYRELSLLQKAGLISNLGLQPKYRLLVKDELICTYIGDFIYLSSGGGIVVEDVKGFKTPVYRLKKKLMKAIYGIEIKET